jgi:predicted ATPase
MRRGTGQLRVTNLVLNRLEELEATAIIECVAGNKELPADLIAQIVGRTDGVPLFVEEMTKAVLEAQNEAAAPAPVVPATLHGSLMARLDRLGSAREVAQIASAIGREFSEACGGGAQAGGRIAVGARGARCGWSAASAGHTAPFNLPVQA